MKAEEGFLQVRVTIEGQEELDIFLDALQSYAQEHAKHARPDDPEYLALGDKADAMRVQIAEAAGL